MEKVVAMNPSDGMIDSAHIEYAKHMFVPELFQDATRNIFPNLKARQPKLGKCSSPEVEAADTSPAFLPQYYENDILGLNTRFSNEAVWR